MVLDDDFGGFNMMGALIEAHGRNGVRSLATIKVERVYSGPSQASSALTTPTNKSGKRPGMPRIT